MRAGPLAIAGLLLALGVEARAGDPAPSPKGPPAPESRELEGAFLPKQELQVPEFLAKRPTADGRGIVVAVLDTGVDPGHPRLAKTTTGERKLVDFLDATDDGLVDTSRPVELVDGKAVGSTGRSLTLGAHVVPGKRAYLGRVDAVDVLPPELLGRLRETRRERLATAVRRAKEAGAPPSPARAGESADLAAARRGAEAAAREALPDDVPAFDVLVAEHDDGWVVVLDTDADGDLAEERELRDFGVAQEWATLHDDAELNVGVRPDPDGKRVRLLFDGGGHGTHVAGIVAGFEADGSPANGIAPGARLLAIKVGNSRWGGPTTNFAIARALEWAGQRGAQVVNLSFGGASFLQDAGTPDSRAADEAVERYGLLCCFSAGNEGPALSTVGSPATARRVLSVGAYVAPPTMRVSYAQLGPDPGERLFGFSSRGPLPGGDLGVSVVAPGAAWSSVPSWQLVRSENMNGTSMAAPQASGACALLLCAAKAAGLPAPPARALRAILSTARPVEGLLPCEQGAGLLQVDRAFEALERMKDAPEERELRARVVNPTGVGGGVYERAVDPSQPFDRNVAVSVVWPRGTPNEAREAYERRLVVTADRPWIQVPPRLGLNAGGGSFVLRVDPRELPEGLHEGLVSLVDPTRPADGPELRVPVTVIRAATAGPDGRWKGALELAPGDRASRFVRVPQGAARARLRLSPRDGPKNLFTVALSALDAWRPQEERVTGGRAHLAAGEESERELAVFPGTVLEVAVFSHWNQNAKATVDLDLRFEGPVSPDSSISAGPGEDIVLLRLSSPLAAFRGRVEARLTQVVERPEVTREVAEDGRGPIFGGDRLYVSTQRFPVRIRNGEGVQVVPLGTHALDEQREDARWRVVDANGRVHRKAVIDGPFDLGGLPAGPYAVEYETPTWGRAAADTGLLGFEVRRRRDDAWLSAYPTADLAAEGVGADAGLDLPAGSVRSVALRLPGLEAGRRYAGTVEVKGEDGRVRLILPLTVDRRTEPREVAVGAAEDAWVAALRRAAAEVADDPSATRDGRVEALARALRALELRKDDVDLEVLALRLRVLPRPATGEAAPVDPGLAARVEKLIARLDRAKRDDRPRLGKALAMRAWLRFHLGAATEAQADLAEARFLLGEGDVDLLTLRLARGLEAEGDSRDALAAAKDLRDAAPLDFPAAARVVDAMLRLGWGIPAAAELRGWPARFPSRTAELVAYAKKVREAGGDPAPRTLAMLEAGAP